MGTEVTDDSELNALGIREVLDADSRPTFILDLDPDEDFPGNSGANRVILPVFCNLALRLHERLHDSLVGHDAKGLSPTTITSSDGDDDDDDNNNNNNNSLGIPAATFEQFKAWATSVTPHDDTKDVYPLSFMYGDLLWTGSTVRQRWRLISGNRLWNAAEVARKRDLSTAAPLELATGSVDTGHGAVAGTTAGAAVDPERIGEARPREAPPAKLEARAPQTTHATQAAGLVDPSGQKGSSLPAATSGQPQRTAAPPPTAPSTAPKPSYLPKPSEKSSDDTGGSGQTGSIALSAPEKAVADWTVAKPKGLLSEHLKIARSVDWANTPLGPMNEWSPEFRQIANLVMGNPHPAALFWGTELTMLYNEAYAAEVAGNKHPSLMGTGFSGPFAELWDMLQPTFAECARTGISVRKDNDYLPINRRNLLEETYFSWCFTPLYGGTKRILGFYNAPFDTTKQVISHRRTQTINKMGELMAQAQNKKQFWKAIIDGLQNNFRDVPFALLYSVGESEDADHSSVSSSSCSTISLKSCHLEGSIGVPRGHAAAPLQLDLKRSREGFVPSFREAMRMREPTVLHARDGTLPEALLEGIQWRGFGDACQQAIIFPVRPTNGDAVMAFLVLGVNPRRPFDDEYKAFITMLNRHLATSLASVILYEDEVRRSRDAAEAAALEKEHLTQQLDLQASRLRRMTELSPLGMFLVSPEGVLREANDKFYDMTNHTRETQYEMSWMDFIAETSIKTMEEGWHNLVNEHLAWSSEIQLKGCLANPVNIDGEPIEHWVMFSALPEFSSDGSLRSIMGSITDISHLKWAQGLQNRRLQEAEETRRQQNEFIDITSHEMRNPLSAILQCADDITLTLTEYRNNKGPPSKEAVDSCIEAAQTITLCVQHQKAIVDDILTISKLDSNLLVVTPIPTQPHAILHRAVKMFDAELQAKDIKIIFEPHPSYQQLAVDWVTMDPSRVLQILINLMTNAIKFTAPSDKRVITVIVAASLSPPDDTDIPGFQYVPPHSSNTPAPTSDDNNGETIYIRFRVQDTGCGLTPAEKQRLFQRFKQASPRTHAQYGGSGLGLFISKRLAELHGGQIGVASEAGVGSLFGFFVQARRTHPPPRPRPNSRGTSPVKRVSDVSATTEIMPQRTESLAPPLSTSGAIQPITTPLPTITTTSDDSPVRPVDPRSLHILIVEDNLINQRVLRAALQKAGCTVHVANDGLEALAFLSTTEFTTPATGIPLSVILMDLEMPNMDGLTCVKEIRKMEDDKSIVKHVPVIAVTANVRDEQVASARESGMDDVVSKPFRIQDLLTKIDCLLKRD